MLDVLIKNGRLVDGTGNPWAYGDVGIKDGRIACIGSIDAEARETVDAGRKVVAPGFIDGHTHSDLMLFDQPFNEAKLRQGVTTEVVGNCGLAPAPLDPARIELLRSYIEPVVGRASKPWTWRTAGQYMDALAALRPAENVATYVAHGSLRIAAMGFEKRPASKAELAVMKDLLVEGLRAGAVGLSIGLLYAPGSYTTKEELAELCGAMVPYNGLLAAHIRGEGNHLMASLNEVLWIAERSGVPLQVCHLKAAGKSNWGKTNEALELIADARARGVDVACDAYPYDAGSTTLTTLLPPWALEGGIAATLERLRDASVRARLKAELREEQPDWDNLVASTGWHSVYVSAASSPGGRACEGKHIAQIAEARGVDPVDCALDLLLEEGGNVSIVYFHMAGTDVDRAVTWDHSIVISDSLGCVTGKPHPRTYGTFPRLFAKYVREQKKLSLEQAVRKVTSFPAQRFRLGRRGLLLPDYQADVVMFDPDTIADGATYQDPTRAPTGIERVWVNGVGTMAEGRTLGPRPGELIRAQTRSCGCGNHFQN